MLIFLSASEPNSKPVQSTAKALESQGHRVVFDSPPVQPDVVIAFDTPAASVALRSLPGVSLALYTAHGEDFPQVNQRLAFQRVLRAGTSKGDEAGTPVIFLPADPSEHRWSWSAKSHGLIVPAPFRHGAGHRTLFKALGMIKQPVTAFLFGAEEDYSLHEMEIMAKQLGVKNRIEAIDHFTSCEVCAGILPDLAGNTSPETAGALMSKGIPVLASASGNHRELVTDGITGFYHSPGNHTQLARQIIHLMRDRGLCGYLSVNALSSYREAFSPETAGRLWTGVLEQLCFR